MNLKHNLRKNVIRYARTIAVMLLICIGILNSVPLASALTFSDVPSSHWAYTSIDYMSENGYMLGTGGGRFEPDATLTRAQVITVLYRVSGATNDTDRQPYTDVARGSYYYGAVCWAYSHYLSQCIQSSATKFYPDLSISRVKMATLIWNFAQTYGWAASTPPSIALPYSDISGLTTVQKNALKWCYQNDIMKGVSYSKFSPYTSVTRAQMAKIIYSFDRCVAKDRAFCVGTNYNDSDKIDTSVDATTAKNFYRSMGYDVICLTEPEVSTMRNNHYIKSNILFFSGHASPKRMVFNYLQKGYPYKTGVSNEKNTITETGYHVVGIAGNMDFVDLVVFAGCKTATGNDNIAKRANQYGAKVSIGWKNPVYDGSHKNWLERFNNCLAKGQTIEQAISYADSFIYLVGSHVKDHISYFDNYNDFTARLIRNKSKSTTSIQDISNIEDSPNNILQRYQGNVEIVGEDSTTEIAAIIQELDSTFVPEDYKVYIHKNNEITATIDYVRMIGDFETSTGYTAELRGNTVTAIYDHSEPVSENAENQLFALSAQLESNNSEVKRGGHTQKEPKEVTEALQLALEQTQKSSQKEASQQSYYYYYDVENERACILVYTTYYFDGTDTMGVDLYQYNLTE